MKKDFSIWNNILLKMREKFRLLVLFAVTVTRWANGLPTTKINIVKEN
ncbi:MAG: hypothetical protein V3G42_14325 [Oscillospiraceae bacterium]